MPKIVILGSCRHEPYQILFMPNKFDPKLYKENHEKAYLEACKKVFPLIDSCDEVWVYAPDGIGEHTRRDIQYARKQGKTVKFIR